MLCTAETLREITAKYPQMTVQEFINMMTAEDIEYEEYLAELDRDYRSNRMDYI